MIIYLLIILSFIYYLYSYSISIIKTKYLNIILVKSIVNL